MVIRSGAATFSAIQSAVKKGYANGAWNGTGLAIDSSLAHSSSIADGVGFGPALNLFTSFPATFAGITNIDAGSMLLRYTLNGDANLDQQVDVSDLGILATNWQSTGRNFTQGDFNYDGIVDVTDLGNLATNWQQDLLPASPAARSIRDTRNQHGLGASILESNAAAE
jgi:hypothetical protein